MMLPCEVGKPRISGVWRSEIVHRIFTRSMCVESHTVTSLFDLKAMVGMFPPSISNFFSSRVPIFQIFFKAKVFEKWSMESNGEEHQMQGENWKEI